MSDLKLLGTYPIDKKERIEKFISNYEKRNCIKLGMLVKEYYDGYNKPSIQLYRDTEYKSNLNKFWSEFLNC
jgi:hypothetical protein